MQRCSGAHCLALQVLLLLPKAAGLRAATWSSGAAPISSLATLLRCCQAHCWQHLTQELVLEQDASRPGHCARDMATLLAGVCHEAAAAPPAVAAWCTWRLTLNPAMESCSQGLLGPEGSCALQLVPIQLLADGKILPGLEGQCQVSPSPERQSVALALLAGDMVPAGACSQGCGPPWWQASVCVGSATQDLCIHAEAW